MTYVGKAWPTRVFSTLRVTEIVPPARIPRASARTRGSCLERRRYSDTADASTAPASARA
ncbi:MAG: hypothetical protein DMD88_02845 [Candidatus Rokuibacteriota bacterium]|nr:MAG: hypothetical protein DMD88_02845 [Candidatus Rokubacteria bacterium]